MDELNLNLNSTSKLKIKYQTCFRNELYIEHLNLKEEDLFLLKNKLSESEFDMITEIMNSYDVGSFMLVIVGLRAVCESLINKICKEKNIPLTFIDKKGNLEEKGLMKKYNETKEFISNTIYRDLIYNIITIANRSIHELAIILKRKGSKRYIINFIKMLQDENIFNNLSNKKNESTTKTTTSSD